MNNYDSILKEKKVYKDPEPVLKKNGFTKYFFIDLIITILLLIVSYFFYYHNILSPKNIFMSQLDSLKKDLEIIISPLNIPFGNNQYYVDGSILLQNHKYNYSVNRNQETYKVILNENNKELVIYDDGRFSYLQSESFQNKQYIQKDTYSFVNLIYNFNNNIDNVMDSITFVKNISINNYRPIVEVNFSLTEVQLNQLFASSFISDKIDVLATVKVDGLTGNLIDAKYIINNKTKNTRNVINYSNYTMTLTNNSGEKTILNLTVKNKDFILKVMKEDTLFSVLTGTNKEDSYQYSYQVIDKIYNLSLLVKNSDLETKYHFQSNIKVAEETIQEEVEISKISHDVVSLNENTTASMQYNKLAKDKQERIDTFTNEFLLPISEFINKYKNSIY